MSARRGRPKGGPTKNLLATSPIFEHLEEEFGRAVISAQTCGSHGVARDGERWYVARTHHNMEFVALVDLHRVGIGVHLPLFVQVCRSHRPALFGRPVIRRMFPGFVFVALNLGSPGWPKVRTARGVASLLARHEGGPPVPVPGHAMADLLRRAGDAGFEDMVTPAARAAQARLAGREAERASPWTNLTALSETERVAVLMDVMSARFGRAEASDEAA